MLLPNIIVHPRTRVTASKEIAYFMLLRRWRKADTWDDVRKTVRRGRCYCVNMHYTLFYLLKENYERCTLVIDFRRLTPQLLDNWSETIEAHTGAERDIIFFCDGKAWKTCRPGRGKEARRIIRSIGEEDVNLMQKAYYNGHYGFHGVKMQQMLQADGIRMTFNDSIRRHDSVVLHHSGMIPMISHLTIGDEGRKAKVGADKAHPYGDNVSHACTEAELAAMTPPDRVIAKISNKKIMDHNKHLRIVSMSK